METHAEHVPLALSCWMAWSVPPDEDTQQVTHAVTSGLTVALCGIPTTCQGAPWPTADTGWDFPLVRCPLCAEVVRED